MKTKSFTLIELLVVIVIIGILAGVITLSVTSNINKAKDLKVSSSIISISKALKADSYDSFPIETTACNLKNSCTTLKSRIDLPNITEDIYYKSSSSGEFFVIYGNKPSNTSLGFEITSIDENVKEVPSFDNLVAYYPLSSGTKNGTAISDMSPNSNNGTNNGASSAVGVDGNIGTAMSFDEGFDYVFASDKNQLKVQNNSISFWLKLDSDYTASGEHHVVSRYTWSQKQGFSVFLVQGYINYRLYDGSLYKIANVSYNSASTLGSWHHFTCSYDGTIMHIYIDGVEKKSTNVGNFTVVYVDNTDLCLGGLNEYTGWGINGSLSDVRIYNRALSQEEITLLYER